MTKVTSCFLLIDCKYVEVPLSQVISNGKLKPEYEGKFFYPFGHHLMEVSREDRRFFYSYRNQHKAVSRYLKEKGITILSIEEMAEQYTNGGRKDSLMDITVEVEAEVLKQIDLSLLEKCRRLLSEEENELLNLYFEKAMSMRDIARIKGSSHNKIHNRLKCILYKLLKMMKEAK